MNEQNVHKLGDYLRSRSMEAMLLSSPFNITWLTGYSSSIQTGPSPFEGGPALGWFRDGTLTLVVNDWEAGPASATGVQVQSYLGFSIDEPLLCSKRQAQALSKLLKSNDSLKGKVGVEMDTLPATLFTVLQEALPNAIFTPLDKELEPLRAVKTPLEIEKIRKALKISDLAQAEIRNQIKPGVTELELWVHVKSQVELAVGGRVPVLADLVAGKRTADVGGLPSGYALQSGDPVMLDFVPRIDGYWGDNCAVYFVDKPSPELKKIYNVVKEALQRGAEAIRPGLVAGRLDSLVRNVIHDAGYEPYPHHSGHGLGACFHEEPRIVPYNQIKLEEGMVLVLEPGIYIPNVGGVRLEDAYLVKSDGCEVLTRHLIE